MTSNTGSNSFLHLNKQNKEENVDLSKHLINLMFKEPFYTRIYRSITKIETIDVPTAGVTIIDNNFTLFWNRNFLSSLTPLEVSGLLKHEALHLVFGHVDNISRVVKIKKSNDSYIVYFKTKNNISDFLVPKCSISVDGVSLTVNEVIKKQFSVNIIPYTWAHTSFSKLKVGDIVNTEVDMLARYAFKAIGVMKK